MNSVVVYESMYGNTRRIAESIAEGLGGATVVCVSEEPGELEHVDVLVVGGPTHMHGLATSLSRRMAAEAAKEDGGDVEPGATEGPGLRAWMHGLAQREGALAAAFDTRLDRSTALTGTAAQAIARRLRRRGYRVLSTGSFLVEDAVGPLEGGETDRARRWGAELARAVNAAAPAGV